MIFNLCGDEQIAQRGRCNYVGVLLRWQGITDFINGVQTSSQYFWNNWRCLVEHSTQAQSIIKVIMHGIHRIHVTMIYSWSHSQTGILWPGYGTLDSKELPELHDTSCFMYTLWESHRFELSKLPVFHDFSIFVGWTDRQAGWQTDRQTDRQTHWFLSSASHTEWLPASSTVTWWPMTTCHPMLFTFWCIPITII